MKYIRILDGLRAISILLVLVSHIGFEHVIPGGFGVTIFFFISGFLITSLLIKEKNKYGEIKLKNFYIRRFLRMYPALLVFLTISIIGILILGQDLDTKKILSVLFYYNNFLPYEYTGTLNDVYQISWSLCVEEHFYLFFPFLFLFNDSRLVRFLTVMIFVTLLLRLINWQFNSCEIAASQNYSFSWYRIDSILYGCIFAFFWIERTLFLEKNRITLLFTGLFFIVLSLLFRDEFFRATFRYSLQGIGLMAIFPFLMSDSSNNLLKKLLNTNVLTSIGKVSYSLYLWHWMAIVLVSQAYIKYTIHWYLLFFLLTTIFVIFSYFFIEKPFLNIRNKYRVK